MTANVINYIQALPQELQEKILERHNEIHYHMSLRRRTPMTISIYYLAEFDKTLWCYSNYPNDYMNDFKIKSYLYLHDNGIVKVCCCLYFSSWTNGGIELYNVPIGNIHKEKLKIIMGRWKKVIGQYIHYSYNNTPFNFVNARRDKIKTKYYDWDKSTQSMCITSIPSTKKLARLFRKQYLRVQKDLLPLDVKQTLEAETYRVAPAFEDIHPHDIYQFRLEDLIDSYDRDRYGPPYKWEGLWYIKAKIPYIYSLLEKYDELYTPMYNIHVRRLLALFDNPKGYSIPEYNSKIIGILTEMGHQNQHLAPPLNDYIDLGCPEDIVLDYFKTI